MFNKIKKVMEFIKEKKELLIVVGWFALIAMIAVLLT